MSYTLRFGLEVAPRVRKRFITTARIRAFAIWMFALLVRFPLIAPLVLLASLGEAAMMAAEWLGDRLPGPEARLRA